MYMFITYSLFIFMTHNLYRLGLKKKKDHASVLVLRHSRTWACELLTNRHRRSRVCILQRILRMQHSHITFLPQRNLCWGVTSSLRSRSFHYLWTITTYHPLRMLRSFYLSRFFGRIWYHTWFTCIFKNYGSIRTFDFFKSKIRLFVCITQTSILAHYHTHIISLY